MLGKIIHLDEKGFGFITSAELEFTRIFFHWTGLTQNTLNFKQLKRGMKVEFEAKQSPNPDKGWRAVKIKVIENDSATTDDNSEQTTSESTSEGSS